MPPKAAATGAKGTPGSKDAKDAKGRKGKKTPADAVTVDMTQRIAELEARIVEQDAALRREQEARSFFQLERDKVHTLYEVAATQLQAAQAALKVKDREAEEIVENHQVTVKVYQQKIKDILYGHQQDATGLKISSEQSLRAEEDFHRVREQELQREVEALQAGAKELSLSAQDQLRAQRDGAARSTALLREQYEGQLWTMQKDYERKLRDLLAEAEARRKAEVLEVETAKNGQVDALIKQHEKNFAKMKQYYTGVTNANLDLIKALKDEVENMKKRQLANEQLMFEVAQENRRLTQPLQTALAEIEALRRRAAETAKENTGLRRAHGRAEALAKELRVAQWEAEQLRQSLRDTAAERDDLRTRFEAAVQDVAQRGVFRETLLERRVAALNGELESKQAQLSEVLAAANLDGNVAAAVSAQLDSVLDAKNRNIRELSFELARVMRLYNEAIRVFRGKLCDAGLDSTADLDGFRPFEVRED